MNLEPRPIVVTAVCGLILWLLLAQVNHYLAVWQVHLWVGGLFVAFATLRLGVREGFGIVVIAGAVHDATSPVPFGLHILLFAIAHAVIVRLRNRFPREETVIGVLVALLANLGLFLVFSFTRLGDSPSPGLTWLRLFTDLLISQIVLAAICPWFLALQARALEITGAGLRTKQHGVI